MRRGEVWTAAAGQGYAGKPRPVVILQDDRFHAIESVTICALTTEDTATSMFRLAIEPHPRNGLRHPSYLMVDKISTVPKSKIGQRIGALSRQEVMDLNRAIMVFLGLAAPQRAASLGRGESEVRP